VNGRMAFWDAMIIGACLENKIVRFLPEDLPGGTIEGIEVLNPFD
jgi:predicted nucleic acid-binding protein